MNEVNYRKVAGSGGEGVRLLDDALGGTGKDGLGKFYRDNASRLYRL